MSSKAAPEAKSVSSAPAKSFTPARAPMLLRKCACGSSGAGDCDTCNSKHVLQRSASGPGTGAAPPIVDSVLSSPGRPLDTGTRGFMESRFGHDFSQVRVHTDQQAAESARAVNAHAYTVGQDIAFAGGKYDPDSNSGRHLLAHELAHTIQQRGLQRSSTDLNTGQGAEYQRLEREADSAADAVTLGQHPGLTSSASRPLLSRADADKSTITPAKSVKPKPKTSSLGTHVVTPTEVFTTEITDAGGAKSSASIEEYIVDYFYMPASKGPNAKDIYEGLAGKALETTVEMKGGGKTKTALWQTRPPTDDLRDLWLNIVGWSKASANDLWERSGGDKVFPQVGGKACQMDHIVELQIGGNNVKENIQPLDATQNQSSGGNIKGELETLAVAIANDNQLSSGAAQQLKLRFAGVKPIGVTEKLPTTCPVKTTRTCLGVEACAKKLQVVKSASGQVAVARADYEIAAGGRPATKLKVPVTFASRPAEECAIVGDGENDGASTMIPGLLLSKLSHRKGFVVKPDIIEAAIDTRPKTRLPLSVDPKSKALHLNVAADGNLTLDAASKQGGIGFTYKYLSPGRITQIGVDDSGETTWKGTINPGVPMLGKLGVEYSKGSLAVTKGLDEEALKKRSLLGMRVTKAQVQLQLAPEFKPSGIIEMQMGSDEKPLAKAWLKLEADDIGLVASGKLRVMIPKMQTAESDVIYKGGQGRNEWLAQIKIKSEDIKLGSSISVSGELDGQIKNKTVNFTGKLDVKLPGNNSAELGLKYQPAGWVLFGGGKFHFPKLDETTVTVAYYLAKDTLVATGKTGFTIPAIGLKGSLDHVTFTISKDEPVKVSGKGSLDFKKGKAAGHAVVELHPSGKFTGKGSLSYAIKENIIVTGTVELDEHEKLHVIGELLITRYEIFKKHENSKELFSVDLPVPVPGLSIGNRVGLVFYIRGAVSAGYSFGPGVIEPLKFSAGFDPLEDDPKASLTVTGSVKVPAEAKLSASISGILTLKVDAVVASAGVEGGIGLTGDLILRAGAFANLDAAYKEKRLTAKVVAGIDAKLLLGLTLAAWVRAYAGAFGLNFETRKDWKLAQKTIDTRLGLYISAPFSYADDSGIKLPELKDVTLTKPEVTTENLKRILTEIFSGAEEKTAEK